MSRVAVISFLAASVAVGDMHFVGSSREKTRDDRVHITGEVLASLRILLFFPKLESLRVVLAAQTLHVVEDEDSKNSVRVRRGSL